MRAMMSVPPPGGYGTMKVMGLVGHAAAGKAAATRSRKAAMRAGALWYGSFMPACYAPTRVLPKPGLQRSVEKLAVPVNDCEIDETRSVVAFAAVIDPEVA